MSCCNLPQYNPLDPSAHPMQQATQHRAPACSSAAGMLRRCAVPGRRFLRTVVHVSQRVSQPGLHLDPPAAVNEAWVTSQRAWVDLAVNQPVELSRTDGKGAAWSSRVHVLGVAHNSAANARSVHEVAGAVRPDAVGVEGDSSDLSALRLITELAQSAPMMKLIKKLMDTPLVSYQQAHGQLTAEEREEWASGLSSARLMAPESVPLILHRLLGMPTFSDLISGALTAHELGALFAFIDSPDGRRVFLEEIERQGEELQDDYVSPVWLRTVEALGQSLAASFRMWAESDPGSELLQAGVDLAMAEAVTPEVLRITLNAYPKAVLEAGVERDQGMCRTIMGMCRGELYGKPHKRVLVIVGRNHVASLIELLKAQLPVERGRVLEAKTVERV